MGIQDRDWYGDERARMDAAGKKKDPRYNPKLFRRENSPAAPSAPSAPENGAAFSAFSIIFFWLLLLGALYGAFKFHQHYKALRLQAQVSAIDAKYWRQQAEEAQRQLANVKAQRLDFFKR